MPLHQRTLGNEAIPIDTNRLDRVVDGRGFAWREKPLLRLPRKSGAWGGRLHHFILNPGSQAHRKRGPNHTLSNQHYLI